jgi:hypothetical protein
MLHRGSSIALAALGLAAAAACQREAPAPAAREIPASAAPAPIRLVDVGFQTPESVLHDTDVDLYLVSNINGAPLEKDGNGFISRVSPEGRVTELKWIDGADDGVTLNAPKGLAIVGDTLYVTDIDAVRMFDRTSGAPKGEIEVPGATFLNDVAPAPGGGVYLTDSGLKAGASGFEPSGSAAVYEIGSDGKLKTLLKSKDLPGPNGVAADGERILVVTFGANELFTIEDGKKVVLATLPAGSLDGLVHLPDGRWAISSWESQSVYAGPLEGPFEVILSGVPAPADIGVDAKRNRLLVPRFQDSEVLIQPLAPPAP